MKPTERFEAARCDEILFLEDGSRWRPAYIRIPADLVLGDPVADARLIASAPEIYQALISLVDLLETTDLRATGRTSLVAKERVEKALQLLKHIQAELPESVKADGDWFHGIENLTQDHDGYVYWKGKVVEHFTFRDDDVACSDDNVGVGKRAAQRVAERCKYLESMGVPLCIRNTTCEPENIEFNA